MKKALVIGLVLIMIVLSLSGCTKSFKEEYDTASQENALLNTAIKLLELEKQDLLTENFALGNELNQAKNDLANSVPRLFNNRLEIINWLEGIPKFASPSEDVNEWFIYALYYQKLAMENGYIISISYTIDSGSTSITCDVITADGTIYYFDPDTAILEDTSIRVKLEMFDSVVGKITKTY
jgi:outer membrane murein-binding lipoprotein Lpp